MPRIAHRAAPQLGTVLALLTLGAFTTAAAQTGSFEPWVLVNEGCAHRRRARSRRPMAGEAQ
jgi:hypothetical protein